MTITNPTTHKCSSIPIIHVVLEHLRAGTPVILATRYGYKRVYAAMLTEVLGGYEGRYIHILNGSRLRDEERESYLAANAELRSLPFYPLFRRDLGEDPDAAIAKSVGYLAEQGIGAVVVR